MVTKEGAWNSHKDSILKICGQENIDTAKTFYEKIINTVQSREQALGGMDIAQRLTVGAKITNTFNQKIESSLNQFKNVLERQEVTEKNINAAVGKIFDAASNYLQASIGRRDIFPNQRGI